jgi:hypothetical protein
VSEANRARDSGGELPRDRTANLLLGAVSNNGGMSAGIDAPLVRREESQMPLIKRRPRGKQMVRYITKLDWENHETLYAYAAFLEEPPEYVLNQLIARKLAKDKDFLQWRENHPESFVPRPSASGKKAKPRHTSPSRMREISAVVDRASGPAIK